MKGLLSTLIILGFKIGLETQIDLIKRSLNNFYKIDYTPIELLSMLRTAENNMVKAWTTSILMVYEM